MYTYIYTNIYIKRIYIYIKRIYIYVYIYAYEYIYKVLLVGSFKLQVSFAECSLFYRALLQKRPIILRSLLMVATPCPFHVLPPIFCVCMCACMYVFMYVYMYVRTFVCLFVCVLVSGNACIYVAFMHFCMCVRVCVSACMRVCVYACIYESHRSINCKATHILRENERERDSIQHPHSGIYI